MNVKKVKEIIDKSGARENLTYGLVDKNELHVRFGPLSIPLLGFHSPLARMIAEEHGVTFKIYNYGVGTGTSDPKPIFSTICYSENELKEKIQRLMQAEKELNERCEWLAEFAMRRSFP